MWVLLNRMMVGLLSLWGIGVYRLNRPTHKPAAEAIRIESPIDFNTVEVADRLWADHEHVQAYLSPDRLKFFDYVASFMHEKGVDCNNKHIADVGCGSGHLLLSIRKVCQPLSMTGLEYSQSAIAIAKTVVPEARFCLHDIYDSTKEYRLDVIVCVQVLEHLLFPDKALRNILAMLNRPGIAFVTVPNGRVDTYRGHINFWSPESWQVFLKDVCGDDSVETGITEEGANFAIIKLTSH